MNGATKHSAREATAEGGERWGGRAGTASIVPDGGEPMDSEVHPTTKGRIVEAAVRLFRDHGFAATSIDEIGQEVGLTGPAIYRHFKSKEELLRHGLVAGWVEIAAAVKAAQQFPAGAGLDYLIRAYVDIAIADRHVIALYLQDQRALPDAPRRELRSFQRQFVADWTDLLGRLRPDLSEPERSATVQGVVGLINSVAHYESALSNEQLRDLLCRMAAACFVGDRDVHGDVNTGTGSARIATRRHSQPSPRPR